MNEIAEVEHRRESSPLLERQHELDRISAELGAAAAGMGNVLLVEGPSGIGKSRLLAEAAAAGRDRGFRVLHAAGGEFEREYPLGVILDLFETMVATAGDTERARLLSGPASAASAVFEVAGAGGGSLAPNQRFALIHGLYWLLINLTAESPVAVIVDDVQWVDDFSMHCLAYLAGRLTEVPVALVAAVRRGDPMTSGHLIGRLYDAAQLNVLRPSALSAKAVAALVEHDRAAEVVTPADVESIVASTGGNPFLVRQLTAAAADHPDGWRMMVESPSSYTSSAVSHNVMVRLHRVGSAAVSLARAASVVGDGESLKTVAQLAQVEVGESHATLEALRRVQIIRSCDPVAFFHPIVRAAIYAEIPAIEGLALHKRAAVILHETGAPSDVVARHLVLAPPSSEQWVRRALQDGGRLAARRGSPEAAIRYLRRALDLTPPTESAASLCVDLALSEAAAGEPTSVARFVDVLGLIDDPAQRSEPLYALGQTLYRRGRHREAAQSFREGADMFALSDLDQALWFESAYASCAHYLPALRPEAMLHLESVAKNFLDRPVASDAERAVLGILALYRAASTPSKPGIDLAERALGGGSLMSRRILGSVEANLAITSLIWSGKPEAALEPLELVLDDARERGDTLAHTEASFIRALARYRLGRLDDASADAQTAVEGVRQGWGATLPGPHGVLVDCLLERGEVEQAQHVVAEAAASLREGDSRPSSAWLYWSRGRVQMCTGGAREALADMLRAGQILGASGIRSPGVFAWRSQAALAAVAVGQKELGQELIAMELELAYAFSLPECSAAALRVQATTEDHDRAVATLQRAAVSIASRPSLTLCGVLVDLGARRRRAGRPVEAREDLRQALQLARRLGAVALAEQSRSELLASGARPRRDHINGIEALTASEHRIARLAADGLTNRRVAESLFLTKNTVEWHLRNVYRKLGIASREELHDALGASKRSSGRPGTTGLAALDADLGVGSF